MHALNQGRICLQPLLFINRFSLPRTDDPFYNNFPFLFVSTNTCGWLNCELGECRGSEWITWTWTIPLLNLINDLIKLWTCRGHQSIFYFDSRYNRPASVTSLTHTFISLEKGSIPDINKALPAVWPHHPYTSINALNLKPAEWFRNCGFKLSPITEAWYLWCHRCPWKY